MPLLLLGSYYFYMAWNARYALLLLFSTAVTYLCALFMHAVNQSGKSTRAKRLGKNLLLSLCLFLNLSILFFFKYYGLFAETASLLAQRMGMDFSTPRLSLLLPVGISFYTFQAIGYTVDVYRGDTRCERNFFRYALFVSFFPQLVAGPIERSKTLLADLKNLERPSFEKIRHGFLVMIWGFFLKMVIADRIAIFVDTVYGAPDRFPGAYLTAATILFAFQIYCDFAGYSTIAVGAAEMLGIRLMQNFDGPYLSTSVKEFWHRWHISLSTWFRDYLYIPLGGSRKGTGRKYLNLLIVFALSGLWHGAQWSFVIWGILNGLYQIGEDILSRMKQKRDSTPSLAGRILRTAATFVLIDFAWIFFRAGTVKNAGVILKSIVTVRNPWILFDGSLYQCGLSEKEFFVLSVCLLILAAADLLARRGIRIGTVIEQQPFWFRWSVYISGILAVVVFGVWGTGYDAANFIYFQF